MIDACTRKPEGGKLTATHWGEIKEFLMNFFNGLLNYNGFITDICGF
jgi:hypothetical protein